MKTIQNSGINFKKNTKLVVIINNIKWFTLVFLTIIFCFSCENDDADNRIAELESIIAQINAEQAIIMQNLETFDTLDFKVFTNQEWSRLHESHGENIKVNWPDGRITEGIEQHIEDLKFLFVFAPDTRILTHPIGIGSENHTAVMGIMEGTFTQPMPLPDGGFIPPTGKAFKIPMATIGIWENGVMIEEFLFWDNKSYNDQIGI